MKIQKPSIMFNRNLVVQHQITTNYFHLQIKLKNAIVTTAYGAEKLITANNIHISVTSLNTMSKIVDFFQRLGFCLPNITLNILKGRGISLSLSWRFCPYVGDNISFAGYPATVQY